MTGSCALIRAADDPTHLGRCRRLGKQRKAVGCRMQRPRQATEARACAERRPARDGYGNPAGIYRHNVEVVEQARELRLPIRESRQLGTKDVLDMGKRATGVRELRRDFLEDDHRVADARPITSPAGGSPPS